MSNDNELRAASGALVRIRNVADQPRTIEVHGRHFSDGMRRAANLLEEAIIKAQSRIPVAAPVDPHVALITVDNNGSTITEVFAAPVAAAPVDDFKGVAERAVLAFARVAQELGIDPAGGADAALAAIAKLRTPAAPGIDLRPYRAAIEQAISNVSYMTGEGSAFVKLTELRDMIDASPKGVNTAPRFELTSGQIAQLHDFAGTPVTGPPLEDQEVLVIQHADAGHSGPGLYAHYDELPEEGAIYLDGQSPDSPKGGSDAEMMQLRYQLNSLRRLLSGFDVAVQKNPLQPPCTYLEEVRLSHEFQPGEGQKVAAALRNALNSNSEGAKP